MENGYEPKLFENRVLELLGKHTLQYMLLLYMYYNYKLIFYTVISHYNISTIIFKKINL